MERNRKLVINLFLVPHLILFLENASFAATLVEWSCEVIKMEFNVKEILTLNTYTYNEIDYESPSDIQTLNGILPLN